MRSSTCKNPDCSDMKMLKINKNNDIRGKNKSKKRYFKLYSKNKNLAKCRTDTSKYINKDNSIPLQKANSFIMKKFVDNLIFE